jgi:hypothetical protein
MDGVEPVCGQVCLVFRKKLKQWLAALVLPNNFNDAGVAATIASLDLTKEGAECWDICAKWMSFDGGKATMRLSL